MQSSSLMSMLIWCSLNFSSLLVTKLWTSIYDRSLWKRPVLPVEITRLYQAESMICVDGLIDSDLAIIFHHLQLVTILLNKHYREKTPVDGLFLQECLGFIQFSLIELEDRL